MTPVTASQRMALTELMGDEVSHYEQLILDHCESTGKRYKSLAATIRVWWRRDQLKSRSFESGGVMKPVSWLGNKETPAEKLERAKAIWMVKVRERNNWLVDSKLHRHNADCQGGRVCQFAEHKEPVLPTLAQVLERMK